jgi:hypothetical protein
MLHWWNVYTDDNEHCVPGLAPGLGSVISWDVKMVNHEMPAIVYLGIDALKCERVTLRVIDVE